MRRRCYRCGRFLPSGQTIMYSDGFWTLPWISEDGRHANSGFYRGHKPVHAHEKRGLVLLPGVPNMSWSDL